MKEYMLFRFCSTRGRNANFSRDDFLYLSSVGKLIIHKFSQLMAIYFCLNNTLYAFSYKICPVKHFCSYY
jgi:hypothetical protein